MTKFKEIFNKFKITIEKKYIIGIVIAIAITILVILLTIVKKTSSKTDITNEEIKNIMNNEVTALIYIYNNRSSNNMNKKISEELDNLYINYAKYEVSSATSEEYNELLKILDIDKDIFGTPALIYIKDGKMFANLINIDSMDVVNTFIDDYELSMLK